jgi:uncharacterized protein YegL
MAKKKQQQNDLAVYILLDRSGSMGGAKWSNAIESINGYVVKLQEDGINGDVTLATFDSNGPTQTNFPNVWGPSLLEVQDNNTFDILRDRQSIKAFKVLNQTESHPRGGTPLYDSTAKILDLADQRDNSKGVVIFMTDGEENTSRKWTIGAIKDRIKTVTDKGWEVLFLGAEFNVENYARGYGLSANKFINTTVANYSASMGAIAGATSEYVTLNSAVNFSDELKTRMAEGKTF